MNIGEKTSLILTNKCDDSQELIHYKSYVGIFHLIIRNFRSEALSGNYSTREGPRGKPMGPHSMNQPSSGLAAVHSRC